MWPGNMGDFGVWGWGMMFIGGLIMLLFWGGVIALAFFAIRAIARSDRSGYEGGPSPRREESALEILRERYARGEITREEYLETKRDLET